ncbi:hypothetical protein EDC04DRAFT_2605306 [Pisolithus marmoratus]|nr:hypothetical protein EDC04DRAFT_2605306 [Pisolithus marmoratus]
MRTVVNSLVPLTPLWMLTLMMNLKMSLMMIVNHSMQSEKDEQVVEDVVQSDHRGKLKCKQTARGILASNYKISTHPSPPLEFPTSSEDTTDAEDTDKYRKSRGKFIHILTNASEGSDMAPEDGLGTESNLQACRHGRLPLAAVRKAQELGMCTTWEAQAIADEYGKMLASIMAAAGLMMKATWAESVWNMHQAWNKPGAMWRISMYLDVSFINDEAVCQAQGIFAGSSLCMQLTSKRQTDITGLLDYLTAIIKYKHLDSTATVPLPAFAMLPGTSYDHTLLLKPQESRHDRSWCVLPMIILYKLFGLSPEAVAEEVEITHGQKNVPWRTLLDLLFAHKYTIFDCPSGVPACLNANELHALTVLFLKEQMGNDYHTEATAEDEDDHANYVVPVPAVSFSLKPWTADQHALVYMMDPKAFDIPLAFLKMIPRAILQPHTPTTTFTISHRSIVGNIRRMEMRMMSSCQREGPTTVWWSTLTCIQSPLHFHTEQPQPPTTPMEISTPLAADQAIPMGDWLIPHPGS